MKKPYNHRSRAAGLASPLLRYSRLFLHIKLLAAVGKYSSYWEDTSRLQFAKVLSCVKLLGKYNLRGIWEFHNNCRAISALRAVQET